MAKNVSAIREFLEAEAKAYRKHYKVLPAGYCYGSTAELLLAHGVAFTVNPAIHQPRRGNPRRCYQNAFDYASSHRCYYVEGYIWVGKPIPHAWCADRNGNVIEVTRGKLGSEYFGVPIRTGYALDVTMQTMRYGVLESPEAVMPMLRDDPAKYLPTKFHAQGKRK